MSHTLPFRRALLVLVAGGILGLALGTASMQQAQAEVDATLQSCDWENGGQVTQSVYFAASAFDSDNNVLYTIGGVNDRNDILDRTQTVDYGSAMDPGDGSGGSERNMPKERFGAAAFYRANPTAGEDGYVYVIGGSEDLGLDDENGGRGEDDGYVYDIGANTWAPISFSGAAIGERLYAAAAYDPNSKVAVIGGGTRQCAQETVDQGGTCSGDNLSTLFLEFDDMDHTAVTVSSKAAGNLTLYGHSMTYGNGMIYLHGGTRNGSQANTATMALDTSAPDTADWSTVGNGPRVAFHSAAYDAANDWLIVHGGASGRFFDPSESTNTNTEGFTAAAATPAWVNLSARSNPADRIGATAGYVDNGNFTGVVMATGRRKYQNRPEQSAENKAEVLICGAETPTPETPTPDTPTPGGPTPTPGGTDTPTPVTPVPTAVPGAEQCDGLDTQVPSAVIANALSNPDTIAGWGELCNPNVDPSPWNTLRTYLSLQNPGAAYHPLYNSVVFRCGCR